MKRRLFALFLSCCMLLGLTACGGMQSANVWVEDDLQAIVGTPDAPAVESVYTDSNNNTFVNVGSDTVADKDTVVNLSQKQEGSLKVDAEEQTPTKEKVPTVGVKVPAGEYNEGVVLVKAKDTFDTAMLGELAYASVEELYTGSKWHTVRLSDGADTAEAVSYLDGLGTFEQVDYDYVMGVSAVVESIDVSHNPQYDDHKHHHTHKVPDGWDYMNTNNIHPGGSSDVVVAVIDTGVDYNHLDLRNNIWINTAEIAGNGLDDDGNGYIDDVYGWDCVGDDKDPMDDNGHGTHVAGIIAAENNELGGVGIAYNCKIMVLKAGNSSGYFNNSDIAEAIQYAYMNGASVINMSFGGSSISIAVEEALENAYNSCVLVAAAGNDGACNNLACTTCDVVGVSYPAALPYVIGVMSTNHDGSTVSSFSNYDHNPYNSIEYEVYAVGEAVPSCWPGNKYASLNGTSMAAPTVSGIAALLRSYYEDREMYSTKFIQSQIVNTGSVNPYNAVLEETDDDHSVADVYEAMTKLPKPAVNLYDYSIDDSATISSKNNGNGVVDAGETVRLYISLHNRGGIASNVNVSIDTYRHEIGNEALTDPYFTFVNPTMQLSDIGTYSVRESGDKYFEIVVSPDCPNDYLVNFNIRFTYENGLDDKDETVYEDDGKQKAQFTVSRGYLLPATITEDTVFTADRLYIVGQDVVIPEGITVTFEAGCEIQFYDDRVYVNSPQIIVYGTLNFSGTKDNLISIRPSEKHFKFECDFYVQSTALLNMNYVDAANLNILVYSSDSSIYVYNSLLKANHTELRAYKDGTEAIPTNVAGNFIGGNIRRIDLISGCYIEQVMYATDLYVDKFLGNFVVVKNFHNCSYSFASDVEDNIFYATKDGGVLSGKTLSFGGKVTNNIFTSINTYSATTLLSLYFSQPTSVTNNALFQGYQAYASQIVENYYDSNGNPIVDVYGSCSDITKLWPYIVSVEMFDADGNPITTVGREEIKVRVTFNRPMDTTKDTYLTFGTIEPYADYRINGSYVSDTVWEGTYTLKAQIENGQNYLKVNNACAAEDPTKTVLGEYQLHEFTIDTTAAMAMNLQAMPKDEGIELIFAQDDYDTLLGYNIYRSTEKDGNYVKLNPAILLPEENTFLDDNAEPGKTYWYTYTVVLSDFTESNPAGKVQATAKDTMAPSIYHTPVNQGYAGNNLVISCTASDNVGIQKVTLYYRAVGAAQWKTLAMNKMNDKFSAIIFGSDVTEAGLEYYIVAEDTLNTVQKGSADAPYAVVVKSADALLGLGDVDGNGAVTTKDALMLMQCLNGDLLLSDDEFKRADLNGDGLLSAAEALRILQYVNGKITTLEM